MRISDWSSDVCSSDLIDPACVIGDREADIAMLTLFDSPSSRFFDSLMLESGWRARLVIYRLWPLLVHLRLFGSSYAARVASTLEQIGFCRVLICVPLTPGIQSGFPPSREPQTFGALSPGQNLPGTPK